MNIITLTLNPAFDIHCYAENFKPYCENLAEITVREAGGKGINISRALTANGVENTAVAVLGRENSAAFKDILSADQIEVMEIAVDGRIRENITLHTNNAPETRISFSDSLECGDVLERVRQILEDKANADTVLTLTGRVPDGMHLGEVKDMLRDLSCRGVRIVLDSKSFGMRDIEYVSPWLIKPNEEEIGMYADTEISGLDDAVCAAKTLREKGIQNVMISLGDKGAVLCCEDGCYIANAPRVEAVSTIGAGDSSIAGFIAAAKDGRSYAEILKTAVSYGTAACMTEGTRPPRREDIQALIPLVKVQKI